MSFGPPSWLPVLDRWTNANIYSRFLTATDVFIEQQASADCSVDTAVKNTPINRYYTLARSMANFQHQTPEQMGYLQKTCIWQDFTQELKAVSRLALEASCSSTYAPTHPERKAQLVYISNTAVVNPLPKRRGIVRCEDRDPT